MANEASTCLSPPSSSFPPHTPCSLIYSAHSAAVTLFPSFSSNTPSMFHHSAFAHAVPSAWNTLTDTACAFSFFMSTSQWPLLATLSKIATPLSNISQLCFLPNTILIIILICLPCCLHVSYLFASNSHPIPHQNINFRIFCRQECFFTVIPVPKTVSGMISAINIY